MHHKLILSCQDNADGAYARKAGADVLNALQYKIYYRISRFNKIGVVPLCWWIIDLRIGVPNRATSCSSAK